MPAPRRGHGAPALRRRLGACAAWAAALLPAARAAPPRSADGAGQSLDTRVPLEALPLRTRGRDVVGRDGEVVPLFCVNWYGAHMEEMVSNGLRVQSLANISGRIVELGFNCVRLPFSLDLVSGTPPRVPNEADTLSANPELEGLSPLEVFDATVAALTRQGLLVVLNVHCSRAMWCCSQQDGDGLWYSAAYPEARWLETLELMAGRYRDDPRVVGFDLKNEIRPSRPSTDWAIAAWIPSWGGGEARIPTWGGGDPSTDWAVAAAAGGLRVAAANSNMLIFVSGLHFSLFLCGVPRLSLHLDVPELRSRVVYTVHAYAWTFSHLSAFHWLAGVVASWYRYALCAVLALATAAALLPRLARWPWALAPSARLRARAGRCAERLASPVGASAILAWLLSSLLLRVAAGAGSSLANGCDSVTGGFRQSPSASAGAVLCLLAPALAALASASRVVAAAAGQAHRALRRREVSRREASVEHGELGVAEVELLGPGEAQEEELVCKAGGASRLRRWLQPLCGAVVVAGTLYNTSSIQRKLNSYEVLEQELDLRWGFLLREGGGGRATAPVWLGEFGTNRRLPWWRHMMRYMRRRRVSFAYWALNGEKRPHKAESYGLLKNDSYSVRHEWKLADLQELIYSIRNSTLPSPARQDLIDDEATLVD